MLKLKLEIWYREPRSELLFENYFVLISEGNWPFWVWKNSISFIDFIVSAIVDSSSDDCPVPYGPNIRALDVANITLAKQIIPKNLFQFFHSLYIKECVGYEPHTVWFLISSSIWRRIPRDGIFPNCMFEHFESEQNIHIRTVSTWNFQVTAFCKRKRRRSQISERKSVDQKSDILRKNRMHILSHDYLLQMLDSTKNQIVYYIFFKNHS